MRTLRIRPAALLTAVLLVGAAVPAAAFERVEIRNKDVVLGAITESATTHEYPVDVPRGAVFSLSLPKQKGSRLQGSMGIFSASYRPENLLLIGRRKVQLASPPRSSQRYRAIVQGVNGSTGLYVLKPKVKVQKRFKIRGRRSDLSPPGQITFGALPDYDVDVKITWKGPDPVTLGSFQGPDGNDVVSTLPPKQKKSSSKQKGFRTTQFGDHTVVLDIPFTATQWTLTVTQKAKAPGRTLNLRPAHGLAPDVELGFVSGSIPLVTINGESGAGNEVVLTAANTAPRVIAVLGGDPQDCSFAPLEGGAAPRLYGLTCDDTHSAVMTVGSRDETRRILDFVADPITAPGGDGRTELSDFVYDGGNRLVGWTETRTFDTSGNEHTLVFSGILSVGGAFTYTVHHTGPDGVTRRYDHLPFN